MRSTLLRGLPILTWVSVLAVLGCSGGRGSSVDGATGGDAADVDAAPDTEESLSCLKIRNCIYLQCANDTACAQTCVERGEPSERVLFEQVVACSMQACPTGDIDCRCDNECFGGGTCVDLVDMCTRSLQEGFCTMCV